MESYPAPFNWMEFPEGLVRFSGGARGTDERGHDTFAVAVSGVEYFGELETVFIEGGGDYNLRVVSFGYDSTDVGWPMLDGCHSFTLAQVATVQALVLQLVAVGARMEEPPYIMRQTAHSHFMGQVLFRDGWVLVLAGETVA